jgi:hypothetical protein
VNADAIDQPSDMSPEERLAMIVLALESAGLSCLVMGGHAVRYYGLSRYTNDFDLVLASERFGELDKILAQAVLFAGVSEGNSWRPNDFRRFLLRRLPDDREEWLEFWRHNHLLAPFAELFARRETGTYGGRVIGFLSLPDLIRSKETERAKDWDDVAHLEEFLDLRLHAHYHAGKLTDWEMLSQIRSRRGFDTVLAAGSFSNPAVVELALARATNPISQAFLLPFAPNATWAVPVVSMEPLVEQKLRTVAPASSLHRSLVEVVRRRYKVVCQERDRADKEAIRAQKGP